jgi:ABC-type transport system involved in multi-copper enzyme maturation permease subunit
VVVLLLFIPQILASGLPLSAALWLGRITPAAGFAIQQTVERYDSAISPWAGFGVLCAYTAAALAAAYWLLRRRDA